MASILIVDDEPRVIVELTEALTRRGHTVKVAANGNEALAACRAQEFDVAVIDVIMPEKDGIETLIELRAECPNLKTIVISGGGRKTSVDFLDAARKLGAHATIAKPFRLKQLFDAIQASLSRGSGI